MGVPHDAISCKRERDTASGGDNVLSARSTCGSLRAAVETANVQGNAGGGQRRGRQKTREPPLALTDLLADCSVAVQLTFRTPIDFNSPTDHQTALGNCCSVLEWPSSLMPRDRQSSGSCDCVLVPPSLFLLRSEVLGQGLPISHCCGLPLLTPLADVCGFRLARVSCVACQVSCAACQ